MTQTNATCHKKHVLLKEGSKGCQTYIVQLQTCLMLSKRCQTYIVELSHTHLTHTAYGQCWKK